MEREGYVSLWIGEFDSHKRFSDYISIIYNEDGDALLSEFERDFNIEFYDIDFREVEFYTQPFEDLKDSLEGFSYDNIIIPRFTDLHVRNLPYKFNAVVLLYNFKYDEGLGTPNFGLNQLEYIGTVRYK